MLFPFDARTQGLLGRRALLTGATSPLGAEIARVLAAHGCALVLVAPRAHPLHALAGDLRRQHGVEVDAVAMNLATESAPRLLHRRMNRRRKPVDILANSAGLALWGSFLHMPWERERRLLQHDVLNVVHLTRLFAGDMMARGFGRILQVASVAAFQPTPLHPTDAAAKSFVLNFSEALHHELSGTGVTCTALCPAIMARESFHRTGEASEGLYRQLLVRQGPEMARLAIEAMLAGRPTVGPECLDRLSAATHTRACRPAIDRGGEAQRQAQPLEA